MKSFIDKYEPKEFDDILGNKSIIEKISSSIENEKMNHMIFAGKPGIGKNTTFNIIEKKLKEKGWESKRFNASDDRGIDFIREEIKKLGVSRTFKNKPRIVLMDEGDGLTRAAQDSLKPMLEDMKRNDTCYILFMANNPEKFTSPIKSRCWIFEFKPVPANEIYIRLKEISKKEDILITDKAIEKIAELSLGDVRSAINSLEEVSTLGRKITENDIETPTLEINLSNLITYIMNKDFKESSKLIYEILKSEEPRKLVRTLHREVIRSDQDIPKGKWCIHMARCDMNLRDNGDPLLQFDSLVAKMIWAS
jgi:DNA polymerase III delta prime subunit